MPIKSQVVVGLDFDGIGSLYITHDIATHVDGVEIFDRRV